MTFSPSDHGAKVAEQFNLRRIENLERELAQAKAIIAAQKAKPCNAHNTHAEIEILREENALLRAEIRKLDYLMRSK